LIVAALNLRDDVLKSRYYFKALDDLHFLAGNDAYIETRVSILEKSAKNGIVAIARLHKDFYINAEKISKNHLQHKSDKNFLDHVLAELSNIVHVTKINAEANSFKSEDIVARARLAVDSGDIALATSEIAKLPEIDRQIYAAWIIDAGNYVNSIDAAEEILRYVTRPALGNVGKS